MDTGHIEERLWDYIDGLASPAERSAIETLIAENLEWQERYRELLNIHQLLDKSELEVPSMRFTKDVMEEITRLHVAPATKTYINKNIIRSIGGFFLTMIGGFLIYIISQLRWTTGSSPKFVPRVDMKLDEKLQSVDWSHTLNSGYSAAFMLIIVVSGLFFLDLYLQQKKNRQAI